VDEQEPYAALDNLIDHIGNDITPGIIERRPALKAAVIRGLKVIDRAVKEGRYRPDVAQLGR